MAVSPGEALSEGSYTPWIEEEPVAKLGGQAKERPNDSVSAKGFYASLLPEFGAMFRAMGRVR